MSEWISVKDRLPKSGEDVYVWNPNNSFGLAKYVPNCTCSYKWHNNGRQTPTHWRIPPPPPTLSSRECQS